MRTVEEVRSYAERFDLENDSPFVVPDENLLAPHDAGFVDDVQYVIDFGGAASAGSAFCVSESRPAEPTTGKKLVEDLLPPADNMGPVKYGGETYFPTWGGYDGGVEASIYGTWGDSFSKFCLALDRCKSAADGGNLDESYLEVGRFVWRVWPTGAGVGFAKYKYVLESHGIKLYIHSNPKGNIAPVRVRFGFECIARTDLFEAVETLRQELAFVGFEWEYETLSRVDMQVLLPVDIYEFWDAMKGKRIITQCRGKCETVSDCSTLRLQTVTFRSKNMELCIYDKKAQVSEADSVYFYTFYRWILRGEMPENLTRVEFRFRREMLRRYGVESFEDLRNSQSAMVQVAGRDWFRILARDKVRGSENVIENAPIWVRTLKAFEFYFGRNRDKNERTTTEIKAYKPKKAAPSVDRVLKQAVGCFASVASLTMEKVLDGAEIVRFCLKNLEDFADQLYDKVISRQVANDVVRGFSTAPDSRSYYDCIQEILLARVNMSIVRYCSDY